MKHYLGIDIGGTAVKLGIVDEAGAVLAKAEESVSFDGYRTPILTTVLKAAQAFLAAQSVPAESLAGIGVSATGQIDSRKGIVAGTCGNLPNYIGAPIKAELEKTFGLPVTVANDANCMTLGEVWVGGAQGYTDVIGVTLGTGVGGGVIVNGKVIDGPHGAGGEIGHITVNPHETAVCGCGKHGCLEQYSSATGVVRCMKKLLDENPDTPCTLRGTDFAAKDVFDAARAGDALAAREVDEMTDTLGMALASIASTTDPEMFMVGGGVARAGDVLFNPLREHFKTYAFSSCRETPIVAATLGNDAGIYGAVRLIVGE